MVGIYVHISFTYVILTHNETHSVYKTKIKFHTMHGIYLRCQSRNDLKLTWSMLGLCLVYARYGDLVPYRVLNMSWLFPFMDHFFGRPLFVNEHFYA